MPVSQAQKEATRRWIEKNEAQYKEKLYARMNDYYHRNSKDWNEKRVIRQRYARECNYEIVAKIFLKILR